MREILKKYVGRPLTADAIQRMKFELEKNGCNISYLSALSGGDSFSLEDNHFAHYVRENGMWERA